MYLLGRGIGYSASPALQNAALREAGLASWSYELMDVGAPEVPAAVDRLRQPDVAGANVTIPHKLAVAAAVDELDAQARASGAVNTVVNMGGRLRGSNTDVAGIAAALRAVGVQPGPDVKALVLGGGGSARAAITALDGAQVRCAVRRPHTARLAADVIAWEDRQAAADGADVVVNCTPLGREGELPVEPRRGAVVDLVYRRGGTPLLEAARAAGIPAADGWLVLLEQGAASFEAWTGLPAPRSAMQEALAG